MALTVTFTSEQQVIRTLETIFTQVQQRMDGLPFLNPRVRWAFNPGSNTGWGF